MSSDMYDFNEEDFVVDFTEVKDLAPIPPGKYPAEIKACTPTRSKSSGNPMFNIQWRVTEGEYADRIVFQSLVFTPKAMFMVKQVMTAIGFDEDYGGTITPDDLIGEDAVLQVTIEQGSVDPTTGEKYEPRNRIKKVLPAGTDLGDMI